MAVIQCYVASSSIFNTVAIWTLKIFFLELVSLSDKYLIIFLLSIQSHFCGNHHPWQTMPIQMAIWELMVTRMLLRHIHGNVYAPWMVSILLEWLLTINWWVVLVKFSALNFLATLLYFPVSWGVTYQISYREGFIHCSCNSAIKYIRSWYRFALSFKILAIKFLIVTFSFTIQWTQCG